MVFAPSKKGRGYKKYVYTTLMVAERSGRSLQSVRRDIRDGKLDMGNLEAVAAYIDKHRGGIPEE